MCPEKTTKDGGKKYYQINPWSVPDGKRKWQKKTYNEVHQLCPNSQKKSGQQNLKEISKVCEKKLAQKSP